MKLVSLKRTDKEQPATTDPCCGMPGENPDYPWGTRIYLEEPELALLGITELPDAGTKVDLTGLAMVIGTTSETVDGGKIKRRLELQITDLALAKPTTPLSDRMYPASKT